MASPMTFATVPSCANTTSVIPPTYSLSSAPNTSGGVVSTLASQPASDLRRKIPRQRGVSALGFGLAAPRFPHHLDMTDGLVDGHFEIAEIDRLGQKIERAAVHRGADVAH